MISRALSEAQTIPLAIELAAARARAPSPSIALREGSTPPFASSPAGRARWSRASRRCSSISWTVDLLDAVEGAVSGGWPCSTARSRSTRQRRLPLTRPGHRYAVLDVIGRLVDKSLVDSTPRRPLPAARDRPPVRVDRLREAGEVADSVAATPVATPRGPGRWPRAAMGSISRASASTRLSAIATLRWACDESPYDAYRILGGLARFLDVLGPAARCATPSTGSSRWRRRPRRLGLGRHRRRPPCGHHGPSRSR